jgi:nitroimidazol reductase NimA-like FMN-containing flavoprotein (pyridoxamine 5'-phosphate oxidase superfamily)
MYRQACRITEPERIEAILSGARIGRLATIDATGSPYITPVNFVYCRAEIFFHCAPKGEKLDNLARNPKVCFQVDLPMAYLDAGFDADQSPCRLHQFYHCVVIRGRAREVTDPELKIEALNALVEKHEQGRAVQRVNAHMPAFKACKVIAVRPERISAKSDLAQGKPEQVRAEIAAYLDRRGWPGDAETVQEMRNR